MAQAPGKGEPVGGRAGSHGKDHGHYFKLVALDFDSEEGEEGEYDGADGDDLGGGYDDEDEDEFGRFGDDDDVTLESYDYDPSDED